MATEDGNVDDVFTRAPGPSKNGSGKGVSGSPHNSSSTDNPVDIAVFVDSNEAGDDLDEDPGETLDQKGVPWQKRIRIGKASPERPQVPGRVSALEKSIRGESASVINPKSGVTFTPLRKRMTFTTYTRGRLDLEYGTGRAVLTWIEKNACKNCCAVVRGSRLK